MNVNDVESYDFVSRHMCYIKLLSRVYTIVECHPFDPHLWSDRSASGYTSPMWRCIGHTNDSVVDGEHTIVITVVAPPGSPKECGVDTFV